MSETPKYMRDAVQGAIEAHLASQGGGFLQSFVYAAEAVDSDGLPVMFFGAPLEQATIRSLGLVDYLVKWYDDEAREMISRSKGCTESCCSDEDDE